MTTHNRTALRLLYKEVLRLSRHYDQYPQLKACLRPRQVGMLYDGREFYHPQRGSFVRLARKRFREPQSHDADEQISKAFHILRQLNSANQAVTPLLKIPPVHHHTLPLRSPTSSIRASLPPSPPRKGLLSSLMSFLSSSLSSIIPSSTPELIARPLSSPVQGAILVSHPLLNSPFERKIILLCSHDKGGSYGLVLNHSIGFKEMLYITRISTRASQSHKGRPKRTRGAEKPSWVVPELRSASFYCGGPVWESSSQYGLTGTPWLQALHTCSVVTGATKVADDLYYGGDMDELCMLLGKKKGPFHDEIRLFAGYSVWSPGQLQEEIERGLWFVAEASRDLIIPPISEQPDNEAMWADVLSRMGGEYKTFKDIPVELASSLIL
eukprot:TRINITY_DN7507_c0_g1_i3.p1 TRINITY_DN7507_c0_g1~~TRINITY_DN7507_c0_g1_i3.p1  ORF type:complete len:382 (-),score=71.68 TRINITY_DN7507_c0_g1_i3:123-1268(-)